VEDRTGTELAITGSMGIETSPPVRLTRLALALLAFLAAAVILLATG